MRLLIIAIFVGMLLAPGFAAAEGKREYTNKQQCRRMTKQISHYEGTVLAMAKDRGNALWEQATRDQINRLKDRRADRCPEWGKQRSFILKARAKAEAWRQTIAMAAKGAAKYFSGGAF